MNRTLGFMALIACAMMVSCEKEQGQNSGGLTEVGNAHEVTMPLNLTVQAMENGLGATKGMETKATSLTTGFWFMEYDKMGNLIKAPEPYANGARVSLYVPDEGSATTYVGVVVACTGAGIDIDDTALFTAENCSTIQKLYNLPILNFFDEVNADLEGNVSNEPDLYLFGSFPIESDFTTPDVFLKRNVAKVSITVDMTKALQDLTVYALRVHSAPKDFSYIPDIPEVKYDNAPGKNDEDYIEYPLKSYFESGGIKTGTTKELTYYIPQHMPGYVEGLSDMKERYKETAPEHSTYVEILASEENARNLFSFNFYLGNGNADNFDIESNHEYTLNIKLQDVSVSPSVDKRISRAHVYSQTLDVANSYIIHDVDYVRAQVNDGDNTPYDAVNYAIPLAQMYEYWTEYAGEGNSLNNDYFNATDLIAEVIWMDQGEIWENGYPVITFCNEHGFTADHFLKFKVNPSTEDKGYLYLMTGGRSKGNILIGVRPAGDEYKGQYLWSWHLWLTSYDPDARQAVWNDDYIYTVPGDDDQTYASAVHRYYGWGEDFNNKYIMDRNLGAMTANPNGLGGRDATYGLFYQFGRKDPFRHNNLTKQSSTAATVVLTVRTPDVLYPGEWSENRFNAPWNDTKEGVEETDKSIFDPCPPGWQIPPTTDIYANFVDGSGAPNAVLPSTIPGYNFYISSEKESASPIAFFPLSGRIESDGTHQRNWMGLVWSVKNNDAKNGGVAFYYDKAASPIANLRQGAEYAIPIRCISEKAATAGE